MKYYTGVVNPATSSREARILNRTLHSKGFRCCHKCFMIKPKTTEFFHVKAGDQLNAFCKPCAALRARDIKLRQKSDPMWYCKRLCVGVKARAKEQNLDFNLTPDYLHYLLESQKHQCFYTKLFLDFTVENENTNTPHRMLPSLDKLYPKVGYVEGNVVWSLYYVNRMKNDLNYKEFIELCQTVINTIPA